jgi:hypothetical protein
MNNERPGDASGGATNAKRTDICISGLVKSKPTWASNKPCSDWGRDGKSVKLPLRVSVKSLNGLQTVRGQNS